jgi:hypothetical protein
MKRVLDLFVITYRILLISFAFSLIEIRALSLTMGLLKVGVPKTWDASKPDLKYIRQAGVRQFISTYNRVKNLQGDELLWGDEIEYGVFKLDHEHKKVRLSLRGKEVRSLLFSCFKSYRVKIPTLYFIFIRSWTH